MVTYLQFENLPLKKGPWSSEEDQALIAYIKRFKIWNWNQMPKAAGLRRSGKSCRLRWMNYLRPNLKHGNFTKEEDEIILALHQELGNRWSVIAAALPGRTDNGIKNRYHSHLKKRLHNSISVQQPSKRGIKEEKSAGKAVSELPILDSSSSKVTENNSFTCSDSFGEEEIVFSAEFCRNLDQYLQDQGCQMLIDDENSRNQTISPSSSSNSSIWPHNWESSDQLMSPNQEITVWCSGEQVPSMWKQQPFVVVEDCGPMDYM